MAKGAKTGGRQPGSVNKVTKEFRETVSKLLSDNAENVGSWLSKVAQGTIQTLPDGKVIGEPPDPAKALDLLTKLAEYAAPKLARTEHTGEGGGAVKFEVTAPWLKQTIEHRNG